MMEFVWPWVFYCLPLPLLIRWMLPPLATTQQAALRVPFLSDFNGSQSDASPTGSRFWPLLLAMLCWCLLLTAAARPQWIGDPIELPISGRDLMLAVDLSGSMEAEDFKLNGRLVNRLQATKAVASEFIQRRVGDRVGLILFGRQAYLQTPLTFDRNTVATLLDEAAIGLAGKETAIGDAIGLALKRLEKGAGNDNSNEIKNSQVLVLLTDGANTAGILSPQKAAELAAGSGLKIYTIGIGADEMVVNSLFGSRRINPSADLDEKALKGIAETTGGRYFRARDTRELQSIYRLLDELEPVEQEMQVFHPQSALYFWPLALAMLLSLPLLLRSVWGRRS